MPKFIHADLIALYAEDAAECEEPWLRWQYMSISDGQWYDCVVPILFSPITKYRRKPRTILINGFEVPEPVREPLKVGEKCWVTDAAHGRAQQLWWSANDTSLRWLAAGLIHLSEDAAQIHIDAMLSFTRKG